jgi:hypothetical protein
MSAFPKKDWALAHKFGSIETNFIIGLCNSYDPIVMRLFLIFKINVVKKSAKIERGKRETYRIELDLCHL